MNQQKQNKLEELLNAELKQVHEEILVKRQEIFELLMKQDQIETKQKDLFY